MEDFKLVPLRRRDGSVRAYANVSPEDFEAVGQFKWHLSGPGYAACGGPKMPRMYMHRFIAERMGITADQDVDHVSGERLDNRRTNLRGCTDSQNLANAKLRCDNKSGFKGVLRSRKRWRAEIRKNGKSIHLGCFDTPEEASAAYAAAATIHHGAFARL